MPINFNNVTFGNAQRGWTAGSIAPRAPISGPVSNVPMSGNIPIGVMQAIGNLSAEQAFRNFLSGQVMNPTPIMMSPPPAAAPNPADALRMQQQRTASNASSMLGQSINRVQQQLALQPVLFGGISPMGMGSQRAGLQQQQFSLENQLAAANAAAFGAPQTSGWVGVY